MQTRPGSERHVGFEQLASLAAAAALTVPSVGDTPGNKRKARAAWLQAEVNPVRWRDDGSNPTASVGMRMLTTHAPLLYLGDLGAIRFIQEGAGAKVNVTYVE